MRPNIMRAVPLAPALLVLGCNVADLAEVRDDVDVWIRHGYSPAETLYVAVRRSATTEESCPDIDVDASVNGTEMTLTDDGGWQKSLLGSARCASTTFVLSQSELADLPAGLPTLRIEDDSYAITVALPTLLSQRQPQVVEPASGTLAPGDEVVLAMDVPGDTTSSAQAWIVRNVGSMSCPGTDSLTDLSFYGGSLHFTVPEDVNCGGSAQAEVVVKAEYDMALGEITGLDADRTTAVSYLAGYLPIAP